MVSITSGGAMSDFLERNFLRAGYLRLFTACIPLSIGVFLLQNVLEMVIGLFAGLSGVPTDLRQIQDFQSKVSWVSPLLFAPVVENFFCLLWIRGLSPGLDRSRWLVPVIVAAIAALFHMVAYMEIVYASIFVNFLAFCALIHNVENRLRGFLASVFVHSLTNLFVLFQLRLIVAGH
jgi:hypothetical protein